MITVSSRIKV